MWRVVFAAGLLGGCESESWVFAPTADERVSVPAGTLELDGVAVLTYDPAELPDEVVSDALRLSVESSVDEALTLEYPDAPPEDSFSPTEPSGRNLEQVFPWCGEASCNTEVAFRVVRETDVAAELHLTGDAILTEPSLMHDTSASSDAATLEFVFDL